MGCQLHAINSDKKDYVASLNWSAPSYFIMSLTSDLFEPTSDTHEFEGLDPTQPTYQLAIPGGAIMPAWEKLEHMTLEQAREVSKDLTQKALDDAKRFMKECVDGGAEWISTSH